jgi:uncharacterized protein
MHQRLVRAALMAMPFLTACGGGANPVQPTDLTAGTAAGIKCDAKDVAEEAMTFVVDWKDGQRSALESAMGKGIAVVKYSCDGAKVLPACRVTGDYGYAGNTRRKKVINMKDAIQAQAQFGGRYIGASFQGAFAQGRSLNMAYTTVGANSTTVSSVDKSMLTGRCKGATHFVYEAEVGAFAVATSSKGKASAFGEVFGQGSASGSTSSGKSAMTSDGMLKACAGASKRDVQATESCEAIVRISLLPIDASGGGSVNAGVVDLRSCPEGYVFANSECVPKATKSVFLCDKENYTQCFDFCEKGDMGSCGRLGLVVIQNVEQFQTGVAGFDKAHWEKSGEKVKGNLVKACDGGEANACIGAYRAWLNVDQAKYGKKMPKEMYAPRMVKLKNIMKAGCRGGEGYACNTLVMSSSKGLKADEFAAIQQGCSRSPAACWVAGNLHAKMTELGKDTFNPGITANGAAASESYQRACDGGVADGCYALGFMHLSAADARGVMSDPSLVLGMDGLVSLGALGTAHDKAKAMGYFKRACTLGKSAFLARLHQDPCDFK